MNEHDEKRYAVRSESETNNLAPIRNALCTESEGKVYENIRSALAAARRETITAVNAAMVTAYWKIGREISEAVGDRAEYGKQLLRFLSEKLTAEFGSGFSERNLRFMRQFYNTFPIRNALRAELSWTHYRLLMRVDEPNRRGFSFVARQKRVTSEAGDHYYIDLVFYNYMLKCFVVIDLKADKLTYQDVGQIDFYVRLFDDKVKQSDDNPTIGIVLCADKDESIVKYSVLADKENLFASKYKLYLPSEEELKAELIRERELVEREIANSGGDGE